MNKVLPFTRSRVYRVFGEIRKSSSVKVTRNTMFAGTREAGLSFFSFLTIIHEEISDVHTKSNHTNALLKISFVNSILQ